MIVYARDQDEWSDLEADVVIVGTGAAGMTLAKELDGTCIRVLLLEAGEVNFSEEDQGTYKGEVSRPGQHGPLDAYRRKTVGGTTTVWGGRCSPFEDIDFESRDYIPESGWPISRSDLECYYQRAHVHCDVGQFDYSVAGSLKKPSAIVPDLESERVLQDELWRFSLPTNFKDKYLDDIEKSSNVSLHVGFACVGLKVCSTTGLILHLEVLPKNGKRMNISAKRYVLAAGGLETTRLLLSSRDVMADGVGNEHDLVGRYYASHITGNFGDVTLTNRKCPISWRYKKSEDGVYYKQRLRIADHVQRELGLLNMRAILTHPGFGDPSHGSGVLSGAYLVKSFFKGKISPEYSKDLAENGYRHLWHHLRNIVLDSPGSMVFGYDWLTKRTFSKRKLPSIALRSRKNRYTLHYDSEQTHLYHSKISLGDEVDEQGVPRLLVDWNYAASDVENLAESYRVMASEIEKSNAGEFHQTAEEMLEIVGNQIGVGSHHLGSTRMANDSSKGVVDTECRVFGSENLFVASPSVFCSGGFANPVLTIVAISVRIADRLKKELSE